MEELVPCAKQMTSRDLHAPAENFMTKLFIEDTERFKHIVMYLGSILQ